MKGLKQSIAVTLALCLVAALTPVKAGATGLSRETIAGPVRAFSVPAQAVPPNPPTAESESCDTATATGLDPSAIGLYDTAVCTMTLSGNLPDPVDDGTVIITLVSPTAANPAVLSCAPGSPCQVSANGTQMRVPCGGSAPLGQVQSITCVSVQFTIQSVISSCLSSPTTGCPRNASLSAAAATLAVSFQETGGNGSGVFVLASDGFAFAAPGTAALLVTATPHTIPSNGTIASEITATFACGSGITFTPSGLPLSSTGVDPAAGQVFHPVLGAGENAVCGAGLPGGFTFTAKNGIIFDNGRSVEGVGCGLGPNVNAFGGFGLNQPYHSTAPLTFTCTGAAVLAISNGQPGAIPINVTYASAVGGLNAVGSTLLTVVPAPPPIINMSCSPQYVAAGGPGSICTASVTDPSGVAISGLTGASVYWTSGDSSRMIVMPCPTGVAGSINPTTTPPIAPLYTASPPCQLPSSWLAGQSNTIVNGQASALAVSPPGSSPGTVTISATLGIVVPPSGTCFAAPYNPTAPFPQTFGTGLPATVGCGTGNPVGFTGLASTLSTATGGFPSATVMLNSAGASATVTIGTSGTILIPGATPATPVQLTKGCNQVALMTVAGTPTSALQALISPSDNVVSIWRFSNATKQYQAGFFADPTAPTDFATIGGVDRHTGLVNMPAPGVYGTQVTESYFICVIRDATVPSS